MVNTITTGKRITAPCAVFKIDLKGRFVYIDDEVEELLGASLEELFGKSINEYLSGQSRQLLDDVLSCHNRYESFYDALSLAIKLRNEKYRRFDAVITLNFIGGNPVNYQVILLPEKKAIETEASNIERRFLELINRELADIPLNDVAEIFCRAGGYTRAKCYLPDERGNLVSCGAYPEREIGLAAPAYVELFSIEPVNRFSFNPSDCALHDGFGDNRSEAVLFLNYDKSKLAICLQAPHEYHPAQNCLDDLALFIDSWNERFRAYDGLFPNSERFSLSGQMASSQETILAVVNDNFDVLYGNDGFAALLEKNPIKSSSVDMTRIYESLRMTDLEGKPVPFERTAFTQSVMNNKYASQIAKIKGFESPVLIIASPIMIDDAKLFVYTINRIPGEALGSQSGKDFLLSIVHDIKAPIITIDAFSRRLQKNHLNELSDDGKFSVSCLLENVDTLKKMLEGVEELSRNWAIEESKSQFECKSIVNDIIAHMKALYPEKKYSVAKSNIPSKITGPEKRFTIVLRNIIDNAFKYSAAVEKPKISIGYIADANNHVFKIADNGPGIPVQYRKKVFDPFFRNPNNMEIPGTGIGLAIAYDIVTAWGGSIEIAETPSGGNTVSFTLPM